MFRFNTGETMKIFFVSSIICLGFVFASGAFFSIKNEQKKLAENFVISILIKGRVSDEVITDFLVKLKKDKGISKIEYITPGQAKKDFIKKYDLDAESLLLESRFPSVANAVISENYQNPDDFYGIVDFIGKQPIVDEVLYRGDLINSIFDLRERTVIILVLIGLLILILFTLLLSFTLSSVLKLFREDFHLLISLGSGRFFAIAAQLLYVLFIGTIGSAFGLSLSIIIWGFFETYFVYLIPNVTIVFISGAFISLAFFYFMSLLLAKFNSRIRY